MPRSLIGVIVTYSVRFDLFPSGAHMRYWVRQNLKRFTQTSGILEVTFIDT